MQKNTPKRSAEIVEKLFQKALEDGDVRPQDKHGFLVGVISAIEYLEQPDQASDTLQIEVIGSVRGVRRALVVAKYGEQWLRFERGHTQLQLEDDTFVYERDLQCFLERFPS